MRGGVPRFPGRRFLPFLPAATLGAFWFGGEIALLVVAIGVPALLSLAGVIDFVDDGTAARDGLTGLDTRESVAAALDKRLTRQTRTGLSTACIAVTVDDFVDVARRYDTNTTETLLTNIGERLSDACRDADMIGRLHGAEFAIALSPVFRPDLEAMLQLSGRIQSAVAEPFSVGATTLMSQFPWASVFRTGCRMRQGPPYLTPPRWQWWKLGATAQMPSAPTRPR